MANPVLRLFAGIRKQLNTYAPRAKFASPPGGELERSLRDSDVERLLADQLGPSKLLPQRLAALGLDVNYIREAEPALYRDMQRVCLGCSRRGKCARDLWRGDVEAGMRDYCPNAATIDPLILDRKSP